MSTLAVDRIGQSAPAPADVGHVLGLIGGYQVSQAVYAAAALKLPDLINAGVDTSDDLAAQANAVPDRVHRLLRSLASFGLFTQTGPRSWALTPAGHTLRSDIPGSLHAMALMWNEEHYDAFRGLVDAVRNDRAAFDQRFGTDWWAYLAEHPESSAKFQAAMGNIGKKVHAAAVEAADLADARELVDVGGGAGGLTAAFLARYPQLHATILDLPHVLPAADEVLGAAGVRDRAELVAGNFFESVPAGGDVYLLAMILHDWTDDQAVRLLRAIRSEIPPTGRLLIIDAVLPPGDTPHFGKLLDLTMMAMLPGRERTEEEFADVLARAGFELERVIETAAPTSLIEARPADR
jgi:ubiquinone/menaquinone biosynthesis C-methylase UbiE